MAVFTSEASRVPGAAERGVATLGTVASVTALFSAAACCVLPLALAVLGVGSAGLSAVVPFHWPVTIVAVVAVGVGWFFYVRRRRACGSDDSPKESPRRGPFVLRCLSIAFVMVSALWGYIEAPLIRVLGGA